MSLRVSLTQFRIKELVMILKHNGKRNYNLIDNIKELANNRSLIAAKDFDTKAPKWKDTLQKDS